ncbi:MAG: hypothetical protein ACFCU4_03395 [Puniceicoccaceae bacterium]
MSHQLYLQLVRYYFEEAGFLVRRPPLVDSLRHEKKGGGGGVDLQIIRLGASAEKLEAFQLFVSDLTAIESAIVCVRGWGAGGITARMLKNGKAFCGYLEKNLVRELAVILGKESEATWGAPESGLVRCKRILILPGLPSGDPHREAAIRMLREVGVEHLLTLRSIIEHLIQKAEGLPNPRDPESLQLLHVLKLFEMVRPQQMDLFSEVRTR